MYLNTLDKALGQVNMSQIEVVAVSAGFDAHMGDLASLGLTKEAFREMGRKIASLNTPTFFVLEGGYNGEQMGRDIHELLKGFESR